MTASARRIAHEQEGALALPARREPRRVLVPEVLPDEARRRPAPAVLVLVEPSFVVRDPYGEPAPPSGLLVDVYG